MPARTWLIARSKEFLPVMDLSRSSRHLEAARSKCWLASIALDAARSNNCRQENRLTLDQKVSELLQYCCSCTNCDLIDMSAYKRRNGQSCQVDFSAGDFNSSIVSCRHHPWPATAVTACATRHDPMKSAWEDVLNRLISLQTLGNVGIALGSGHQCNFGGKFWMQHSSNTHWPSFRQPICIYRHAASIHPYHEHNGQELVYPLDCKHPRLNSPYKHKAPN